MIEIEEKYMSRCFELAQKGRGNTWPNPMVGAVIVYEGKIIGEGYHRKCGEAHAEVNAIAAVKDESLLKDSTLYVSLEPCSHYGKTPPCAELIIRKGIPRVVVGCLDPFVKVSGRGVGMRGDLWRFGAGGSGFECSLYDDAAEASPLHLVEMGSECGRLYGQAA